MKAYEIKKSKIIKQLQAFKSMQINWIEIKVHEFVNESNLIFPAYKLIENSEGDNAYTSKLSDLVFAMNAGNLLFLNYFTIISSS